MLALYIASYILPTNQTVDTDIQPSALSCTNTKNKLFLMMEISRLSVRSPSTAMKRHEQNPADILISEAEF
jgi:hypothetical protein